MSLSTEALARSSGRRPWRTVIIWVVALVTAGVLSSQLLGDTLTTESELTNNPESQRAAQLVEDRLRGEEVNTEFVVVTGAVTIDTPEFATYVDALQGAVAALGSDTVQSVGSYLTGDGPVSESGRSALLPVALAGDDHTAVGESAQRLVDAVAALESPEGFSALVAGPASLENEIIHIAEEELQRGESIGLAVALVVLVLVFGAVVAGFIPIMLAIMAIAISLGLAAIIGQVYDLSFFIANIVTMIGLAVGIDYSLFIVSRYREERADGEEKLEAIARAGATASKAVFFSGLTVVLALTGMLLIPDTGFRSIGMGAILVVVVSVIASLTLLPAVLALMGDRIDALKIRGRRGRTRRSEGWFWDRITGVVMRRPVISLAAAGGVLVLAALPWLSMNTGFNGVSTLPDEAESKQAFLVLEREFSGGLGSPVEIVVDGAVTPDVMRAIASLEARLAADPAFGPTAVEVAPSGDLALVSATLAGDVTGDAALDAVEALRATVIPDAFQDAPVEVLVGGLTATNLDILDSQNTYTPIVFVFVLGLSFVLLTVAFRSLVVPAKAIAMNLLSVGAAYGLVTAFFQEGVGPAFVKDLAGWLGFVQVESVETFIPLFMFTVLFGLSMDYHVFLLSRIRERFDLTGHNTESVAYGLRTTGSLITGAAAIMVAVFGGFAAGSLVGLQQMGFGLAVAVALDATVVRSVLVPSTMRLLGNRNWYLPSWLEWLPQVNIEGVPRTAPVIDTEPEYVPAA